MSYGEVVKLLMELQNKSEIPFNLAYNIKEKTIKIDYNTEK